MLSLNLMSLEVKTINKGIVNMTECIVKLCKHMGILKNLREVPLTLLPCFFFINPQALTAQCTRNKFTISVPIYW